jgi:hypothetical protein
LSRLPEPGKDHGVWGNILNDFLLRAHFPDGTLRQLSQSQVANLITDLAAKAIDANVVHKTGSETISGDLIFPEQPSRTGQITLYSVNDPDGFVQKNLVFRDMGVLSRGGPVWMDSAGRVQTWLGWHDQIPGGSSHHGLEVKTAADPSGPNSAVLVTRFRLRSDADQTQAAFYSCEMVYIENGIYSPDTQFGITFNTPESGSVAAGTATGRYTLGKLTVNVDNSGVATMDIAAGLENTTGSRIRVFRDSNVPTANFAIYAADGTATQTFFIDAKTGGVTMAGRLQYKDTNDVVQFNQQPTLDGSNHTIVDNDVMTVDAAHNATYRLFRNTNTTATRSFRILRGDGTNTDSFTVNAGTGDVTVTGDLNVTGNISANNVFDEFELRRSSDVSTLSRMLSTSNLALTTGTVYGVLAYAKTAGTFTRIRFMTGTTVTAVTEVRLGVYNSANLLLSSTANLSATVTTGSTLYDNLLLDTAVTTTVGQLLYLAVAYTGTTLNVRGAAVGSPLAGLAPVLAKTTAYAGGALPSLGSSATGNVAWIELVP